MIITTIIIIIIICIIVSTNIVITIIICITTSIRVTDSTWAEGGRMLMTEILLPRIARQGAVCLISRRGTRKA